MTSVLAAAAGCGDSFVAGPGGAAAGGGGAGASATGGGTTGGGGTGGGPCSEGDMQSCYTGAQETLGKGNCTAGSQTCDAAGNWGPCMGETLPVTETCDGQDEDCNGTVDDGCPCKEGDPCYPFAGTPGEGACKNGMKVCMDGVLVDCVGAVGPSAETCNGLDDDCDGVQDDVEGLGNACDSGQPGVCKAGQWHCNLREMILDCPALATASNEVCDGLDNDCNGAADDLDFQSCGASVPNPNGSIACEGMQACSGMQLMCFPKNVFLHDFSVADADWEIGGQWAIGPAMTGELPDEGNPDPNTDHTPSGDNGVAGVVIGGCPEGLLELSYLTSKVLDVSGSNTLYLSYWRHLNTSGNASYAHTVEVSENGGTWTTIWSSGPGGTFDSDWVLVAHDLSAYAGGTLRIRFGFKAINLGAPTVSSWNIDDLAVASCPLPNAMMLGN